MITRRGILLEQTIQLHFQVRVVRHDEVIQRGLNLEPETPLHLEVRWIALGHRLCLIQSHQVVFLESGLVKPFHLLINERRNSEDGERTRQNETTANTSYTTHH
jgi:hypothetical protein